MLNFSNIRTVVQRMHMASCQRRYLFRASYPLNTDDDMFNRRREMECLSNVLASTPQISVITGPVDSGKSRLVNRVIRDLPKTQQPTPIHSMNLREDSFFSVEYLVNSSLDSWLSHFHANDYTSTLQMVKDESSAIDKLNNLLKYTVNNMSARLFKHGKQHPIFVIDQANRLKTLYRDKDGRSDLENLFQWFIFHSKEKQNFHVVLISSDSFFDQWVEQFVGIVCMLWDTLTRKRQRFIGRKTY